MTRYEQGFLTKCAEYGVEADQAIWLMKMAGPDSDTDWSKFKNTKKLDTTITMPKRPNFARETASRIIGAAGSLAGAASMAMNPIAGPVIGALPAAMRQAADRRAAARAVQRDAEMKAFLTRVKNGTLKPMAAR